VPLEVTKNRQVKVKNMELKLGQSHASFLINDKPIYMSLQMTCPPSLQAEAVQVHDHTTEGVLESCIFMNNLVLCIDGA
jgi:hypothetical protein